MRCQECHHYHKTTRQLHFHHYHKTTRGGRPRLGDVTGAPRAPVGMYKPRRPPSGILGDVTGAPRAPVGGYKPREHPFRNGFRRWPGFDTSRVARLPLPSALPLLSAERRTDRPHARARHPAHDRPRGAAARRLGCSAAERAAADGRPRFSGDRRHRERDRSSKSAWTEGSETDPRVAGSPGDGSRSRRARSRFAGAAVRRVPRQGGQSHPGLRVCPAADASALRGHRHEPVGVRCPLPGAPHVVQNPEKTVGNMLGGHRDADAMNWAMFFFLAAHPTRTLGPCSTWAATRRRCTKTAPRLPRWQ
jgi:hypothetical protein